MITTLNQLIPIPHSLIFHLNTSPNKMSLEKYIVPNKTKVINIHKVKGKRPDYDVYIGREMLRSKPKLERSKWANPYPVKIYGRKKSFELYENYVRNTPELWDSLEELEGKILGGWCKPNPCHGDILIKLLKEKKYGNKNDK